MISLLLAAALAQEATGYSQGPFNLVIRWGNSSPVVVRYETRSRCEMAALMVISQCFVKIVDDGKREIQPDPKVSGPNQPYAFCIPG